MMAKKLYFIIIIILIFSLLSTFVQAIEGPGEGGGGDSAPSVSSGGGGGSRQVKMDDILKVVKKAKDDKDKKYEELRDLLYKEPTTPANYTEPQVYMYFNGNTTNVTRNQPIKIESYIIDKNPQDSMRRVMWLYLQMKKPGSSSFEEISVFPQIVAQNDYEWYNEDGKYNYTVISWPEITSFKNLNNVGDVRFIVNASDGRHRWTTMSDIRSKDQPPFYRELVFNIINTLPSLENMSLIVPSIQPRFNDPIEYVARVSDNESDPVTVTLHIFDANSTEKINATQTVKSGEEVRFLAGNYGFFSKEDAGKNYSYSYTFGDGINTSTTTIFEGPTLKKSITVFVDSINAKPEDQNQYWWQNYNFSIYMKNMEPGNAKVTVDLQTDTPAHPWRTVKSEEWDISDKGTTVWYNVRPFFVEDANQTYRYRFIYSEIDHKNRDRIEANGPEKINPKLVKYEIASLPALLNMLAILGLALLGAIVIERRFYR